MLSDRVRHRLEELQRTPRADQPTKMAAAPVSDELDGEERSTPWGPHWQFGQPLHAIWPACTHYLPTWPPTPHRPPPPVETSKHVQLGDKYAADIHALSIAFPRRTVFLDLETCGFAGSTVFLVGLLHWHHDQLVATQLWARDYSEEKAMLQSMWSIVSQNDVLVTFNGKSFDWPQVHDRSTLHHLGRRTDQRNSATRATVYDLLDAGLMPDDSRPEPWHFDLLHHARRRWRGRVPNCRLQTLERFICGRNRVGDLPGSQIPGAYHEYVRSGSTRQVRGILHHNALDLVTLLQLSVLFLPSPDRQASGE